MPKLQMLHDFKKLPAGKIVMVEDEVQAKWLVDRKYAIPFIDQEKVAKEKK